MKPFHFQKQQTICFGSQRIQSIFRSVIIFVIIAAGLMTQEIAIAQPLPERLTQRAEIAAYHFTIEYPDGWSFAQEAGVARLVNLPAERVARMDANALDQAALIYITVEERRDHADAVKRLDDIRSEYEARAVYLEIGGWPALQRRFIDLREQPGDAQEQEDPGQGQTQTGSEPYQKHFKTPEKILRVTTAIAADNFIVRLEGRLLPDAPESLEATVNAIGRSAKFRTTGDPDKVKRELENLKSIPPRKPATPPPSKVKTTPPSLRRSAAPGTSPISAPSSAAGGAGAESGFAPTPMTLEAAGLAIRVIPGAAVASEGEIAVSTNGQNIVISAQGSFATSNNGGQTFRPVAQFPGPNGGDPSLAFGRSGTFYEATISIVNSSTAMNVSTDNGQTFTFRANAYTCPTTGPNQCTFTTPPPASTPFPDQEHIAADRFNASAGGGDQVYAVWRNGSNNYGIACSNDGGQNWANIAYRTGDFPRITVGQDGFVYVVYQNGNVVTLSKYSSCNAGLAIQTADGFPLPVVTLGNPEGGSTCVTVPGLDRCNSGNRLSSWMVAVDDTNANHIYIAYSQNTSANNENIVLRDSIDGGINWPATRVVTVSSAVTARRFMPWVCSAGGVGYVSWFDRRAATAASNSLTDYFAGSGSLNGSGNLVAGPERQVNPVGTADDQCRAGFANGNAGSWPCVPRATTDSQNCTFQPQQAGLTCKNTPPNATDTNTPCDVIGTACPGGETCQGVANGGCPKYGDYTGNACAAGRFYTMWPSATLPPPAAPGTLAGRIDTYFAALVVAGSQIQIPGPVVMPDTCIGTSSLAIANVCNTGTKDLHIDPITSSNPEFSVIAPSSGYPVTIAAGSCFPFQVRFIPTSPGLKTASLTVPSDDTVTPSATISVSGRASQAGLTTIVPDSAEFGNVCTGSFRDLPLVLTNPGACTLRVNNITSSTSDFVTAQTVSYPFMVAPGNSVQIPIRFQPTSNGSKSATLTVNTNDPVNPARQIRLSGVGGQPVIATTIVDTGNFGSVCIGATHDEVITVTNSGTCPLEINNITSSSAEFQTAQVQSFPLVVAPGTSIEIPIRYAPTTPGAKSETIVFITNDPVTPNKAVTVTADTPDEALCNPPTFAAVGMSIGPTFGSSKMGDVTFTGNGRYLVPFGEKHSFGFQAQGEYLYYHGRHEGETDFGLMKRWKIVQFGLFGSFKFAEFDTPKDGGVLGQSSAQLDLLFSSFRIGVFGSKGFKDAADITTSTSIAFPTPIVPGATIPVTETVLVAHYVDTLGAGGQVGIATNTDLEGHLMWLRRSRPTPLGDEVGAMVRVTQHISDDFALFGELTYNETFVGPTGSGRVIFGFVFGHWPRPKDLKNKHTPLATDVVRVHYDFRTRQR